MAKRKNVNKTKKRIRQIKVILYIVIILAIVAGTYFGIFDDPFGIIDTIKPDKTGTVTELDDGKFQLHMIDVGQADAFLLRIPDGKSVKNILIDAGSPNKTRPDTIPEYLSSLGIKELEMLVLTHPHYDHIGAAQKVIESTNVKSVMIPDCDHSTKTWIKLLEKIDEKNINVIFSEVGKTLAVGDAEMKILAPSDNMLAGKEVNDYSIVAKVTYGETSFMFTGDAESDSEAEIIKAFPASELKCNVLKVGHHGSSTSSSQAFLNAVKPDIALISCGKGNDYGHPHKETMQKLGDMGINIFRTDEMGTVIIVSDGKTVSRLEINK